MRSTAMWNEGVDTGEEAGEGTLCQQMELLKEDIRKRKVEALAKFWGHEEESNEEQGQEMTQEQQAASRRQADRRQVKAQWTQQERRQGDRRVIGKFTQLVNQAQW